MLSLPFCSSGRSLATHGKAVTRVSRDRLAAGLQPGWPSRFRQCTANGPDQEGNSIGQPVRLAGTPSVHPLVSVSRVPHVLVEVPAMRLGSR